MLNSGAGPFIPSYNYPAILAARTSREKQARPSSTLHSIPSTNTLDIRNSKTPSIHQYHPLSTNTSHTHPSKWTPPLPPTARTAPSSGSTTRRDTVSSPPRTAPPTSSSTSVPSRYVVAHLESLITARSITDPHHRRTASSPLRRARLSPSSPSRARRACRPPASATTKRCSPHARLHNLHSLNTKHSTLMATPT